MRTIKRSSKSRLSSKCSFNNSCTTCSTSTTSTTSGFTLIELLVALGVISIVFLLGLASYRDFTRNQQIVEVGKQVRQDLLLAQQKALSGEKSTCGTLSGYTVTFAPSSYQIIADCTTGTDPVIKSVNLPGGITKSGGATSVTFKVLAQGTTQATDSQIVLTSTLTGKTVTINVTRAGSIY